MSSLDTPAASQTERRQSARLNSRHRQLEIGLDGRKRRRCTEARSAVIPRKSTRVRGIEQLEIDYRARPVVRVVVPPRRTARLAPFV